MKLARQLIDQISEEKFQPEKYEDVVRKRIEKLIQQKLKGKDITEAAPAERPKAEVIDLMEALKASLGKKKAAAARPSPRRAGRARGPWRAGGGSRLAVDAAGNRLRDHAHRRRRGGSRQLPGGFVRMGRRRAVAGRGARLGRRRPLRQRRRRGRAGPGLDGPAVLQALPRRCRPADARRGRGAFAAAGRPPGRALHAACARRSSALERGRARRRAARGRGERARELLQRPALPHPRRLPPRRLRGAGAAERALGRRLRVRPPLPQHRHQQARVRARLRPRRRHLRLLAHPHGGPGERGDHERGRVPPRRRRLRRGDPRAGPRRKPGRSAPGSSDAGPRPAPRRVPDPEGSRSGPTRAASSSTTRRSARSRWSCPWTRSTPRARRSWSGRWPRWTR